MTEIQAREAHLKAALVGESKWYQDHFDGWGKLRALLELSLSFANRWLWGYGERAWVLARNLLILAFLVFPALFWMLRGELQLPAGQSWAIGDTVFFSLQNILPAGIASEVVAIGTYARFAAGLEAFIGIVAIGLFASYVFRWSLHR